jgi:hypothetical protein
MLLTNELIRKAVDAYDAERCRIHGHSGLSETDKRSIAPMIAAAIRAVLDDEERLILHVVGSSVISRIPMG